MSSDKSILIIDDERNIRKYLADSFAQADYDVYTAKYGKEGLNLLLQKHIDVILLDLKLPDISGLDVLKKIREIDVQSVVIMITAYGNIHSAVEAMKMGAYDYMTKPFDMEDIKLVIKKAFRIVGLEDRIRLLEQQVSRNQYGGLITRSKKMSEVLDFAKQVAGTMSTVMIYGDTGTGKELVAGLIHRESLRAKGPFVPIDCTSLPENLLESELFGHERGAFTGAIGLKKGLFEVADGGTVFLDEIGELPLTLQAKILRVLESRRFRRVGSEKYLETDVRIIAATNRNLRKLVEDGSFRSDLFYRLNVVPINLPSLSERKEDIFPLVEYFVQVYNKKIGKSISNVSNEALKLLIDYDWPGNIRELKNVIEHMVITSKDNVIRIETIPGEIRGFDKDIASESIGLEEVGSGRLPDFHQAKKEVIENFEKKYLMRLLESNQWNISKSAREMKTHRSSLQRLIRKHNLKRP